MQYFQNACFIELINHFSTYRYILINVIKHLVVSWTFIVWNYFMFTTNQNISFVVYFTVHNLLSYLNAYRYYYYHFIHVITDNCTKFDRFNISVFNCTQFDLYLYIPYNLPGHFSELWRTHCSVSHKGNCWCHRSGKETEDHWPGGHRGGQHWLQWGHQKGNHSHEVRE